MEQWCKLYEFSNIDKCRQYHRQCVKKLSTKWIWTWNCLKTKSLQQVLVIGLFVCVHACIHWSIGYEKCIRIGTKSMWRVSQNNYLRNLPYYYLIYDHHHLCGIYITYLSSFLLDLYVSEVDNNLCGYFK